MTPINNLSPANLIFSSNNAIGQVNKKNRSLGATLIKIGRKAIYTFSFHKLCAPPALKKIEIRFIKKFNQRKLLAFPKQNEIQKAQPVEGAPPKPNETIDGMHEFAHDMMELVIKCLQEYIDPKLKKFNENEAHHIPQHLKKFAEEAISVGTLTAAPIFEIIRKFQVNEQAMDQVNKVLNWALKDIKPEDEDKIDQFIEEFKEKLLERKKNIAPEKVPEGAIQQDADQQVNDCADEILNWLFNSDHSVSPYNLFENKPHKPSEEVISQILQTSFQILAERKIDLYTKKADDILKDQLPKIVEETIHDNAIKITDSLSARLGEVLEGMDDQFPVLFDKIIEIVGTHFNNIAQSHETAEKAALEHKALKKYALNIVKERPQNPDQQKTYDRCKEYLEKIKENDGIAQIKEDVLLKTFLALTKNAAPCINSHLTENISQLILETLLPSGIKNGKQVSGLENLLSTIEFPKAFKDLFDEAKDIAEMIIGEDQFKELKTLGNAAGEFKQLAFQGCAEVLKLGINEALGRTVSQMAKPDELNLKMVQSMLPAATETMIKFLADDLIQANIRQVAPFFQKLPNEKEEEEKLLQYLFGLAQTHAKQFGFAREHEEAFFRIVKPRIDEIVELIGLIKEENPKKSDLRSTIAIIKEYYRFDTKSKDNNPHFMDFVDVPLRTGEFGTFLPGVFKLNYPRNLLSKLLTDSVQNLRNNSYRPGLNMAIPLARKNYLQQDYIKELFFQPSLESLDEDIKTLENDIQKLQEEIGEKNDRDKEEKIQNKTEELNQKDNLRKVIIAKNEKHEQDLQDAQKKLPGEVDKMARLGYDILLIKTKRTLPFLGPIFFKKIVGNSAEKMSRVALSLINKTAGYQAFNEHLLNRIFFTSAMGLHKISIATEGTKPLLQKSHLDELNGLDVPVSAQSVNTKPLKIKIDKPLKKHQPLWKTTAYAAIKRLKNFFKWFKPKKLTLEDHQIKLMESLTDNKIKAKNEAGDQKIILPLLIPIGKQKKEPLQPEVPNPQQNVPEKRHAIFFEEENPKLSGPLKKVGKFVSDFMKKNSDEIFETKIKPWTQFIEKDADQLPQQVNQILDWTNRLTTPLANTIIKKISEEGYGAKFDEVTRGVLNILFKDLKDKNNAIQNEALEDLEKNLKKVNGADLLNENELENYIAPIRKWILQDYDKKEKIKSLQDMIEKHKIEMGNFPYEDEKVRKFYVATVQWLVDYKIKNHVVGGLQKFLLDKKLSGLIKTHLEKNMQHLSKLLFNRIAGVLNNVTDEEYKEFFDNFANDINDHMENLIKAEAQPQIKDAKTEDEKKRAIAKELASGKLDKEYEPMYKLHPLAKALLRPPAHAKTDKDVKAYKIAEENKKFEPLVKRMLDIALPEGEINIDGKVKKVDAFQELWDNIIIEPEVTEAIDELRQLVKSLLPTQYAEKLDIVESKAKELTKNFVLNSIKQYATKALAERLRESLRLISNEDLRREVFAENFPIVQQTLIKPFVDIILNGHEPEKLFKRMIEGEGNKEIQNELVNDIWELCSEKFKYSWKELNISREEFERTYLPDIFKGLSRQVLKEFILSNEFKKDYAHLKTLVKSPQDQVAFESISGTLMAKFLKKCEGGWNKKAFKDDKDGSKERESFNLHLRPLIDLIVLELKEKQNAIQRANPHNKLNDKDIEISLAHFFKGENDQNLQYVDMITNMIKMGDFDNYLMALIVYVGKTKITAKKFLTKLLLPALQPVRGSLHGVIDMSVGGLEAKFLNDDYIKNLINPKTLEVLAARQKKINHEIEDIEKRKKKPNAQVVELNKKIGALEIENGKIEKDIEALQKLKDEEPQRQEKIQEKFNNGLQTTICLLYDLIEYSAKHAADRSWKNNLAKWGWNIVRKPNPEMLLKASENFYKKFFDNEDLNEALLVNIMEKALKLVEEQNVP